MPRTVDGDSSHEIPLESLQIDRSTTAEGRSTTTFRSWLLVAALLVAGGALAAVTADTWRRVANLEDAHDTPQTGPDESPNLPVEETPRTLVLVNPCPQTIEVTLNDPSDQDIWTGTATPGPVSVDDVPAEGVSAEWSVTMHRGSGVVDFELGEWFGDGVATIPALSCPAES